MDEWHYSLGQLAVALLRNELSQNSVSYQGNGVNLILACGVNGQIHAQVRRICKMGTYLMVDSNIII